MPKILSQSDRVWFLARAGLLRRIDPGNWILLYCAACCLIWSEELSIAVLTALGGVALWLVAGVTGGRRFRCPHCGERFGAAAALAIASGNCIACGSAVLGFPPEDGARLLDRRVLVRMVRRTVFFDVAALALLMAAAAFLALLATEPLLPWLPGLLRLSRQLPELTVADFLGMTFAGFFLASRIGGFVIPRPRCPHCRGRFDRGLARLATASGRCGLCGGKVLDAADPEPRSLVCRLPRIRNAERDLLWIGAALAAAGLVVASWSSETLAAMLLRWAGVFIVVVLLAGGMLRQLFCRHRKWSPELKTTGRCAVCGGDLSGDPVLFAHPDEGGSLLRCRDDGYLTPGALVCLMIYGIPWVVFGESGGSRAVFIGVAFLAGWLWRRVRCGVQAVSLMPEELTLIGASDTVVRRDRLVSARSEFRFSGDQLFRYWRARADGPDFIIGRFADDERAGRELDVWFGLIRSSWLSGTQPLPVEFSFHPDRTPERMRAKFNSVVLSAEGIELRGRRARFFSRRELGRMLMDSSRTADGIRSRIRWVNGRLEWPVLTLEPRWLAEPEAFRAACLRWQRGPE